MDFNGYETKYEQGMTIRECAKEANTSYHKMRVYLHSIGVVRSKSEARNLLGPIHRKYTANHSFFNDIDTEEKAYWLGFITADGHVNDRSVRLELAIKDKNHLIKFLSSLESEHLIYEYKDACLVAIKSRELAQDLHKLGLHNNKSVSAHPASIPKELLVHYWRGVFDGDGHISDKGCVLAGTQSMCEGFKNFLINAGISTRVNVLPIKNANCFKFATSGLTMIKSIHSLLYDNSNVSLDRKREVVGRGF